MSTLNEASWAVPMIRRLQMKTICVFTPTFNRGYIISKIYESLERQSLQDFVWLVVDDGSTDNTEELFDKFVRDASFPIIYKRVENGGKQRAHDYAVSICDNELFFCLDSDDHLTPDAIETIVSAWEECKNDPTVGGILALRGTDEQTVIGTKMPCGVTYATQHDLFEKYRYKGDSALIYRTDVLRQFPFDVEPGEKFIPETFVYFQIDQKYRCRLVNKIIQVGDYLPDGYTSDFPNNVIASPKSYLKHKKFCMEIAEGFLSKLYCTAMYMVAHHLAYGSYGVEGTTCKYLVPLALPLAAVLVHTKFLPHKK